MEKQCANEKQIWIQMQHYTSIINLDTIGR